MLDGMVAQLRLRWSLVRNLVVLLGGFVVGFVQPVAAQWSFVSSSALVYPDGSGPGSFEQFGWAQSGDDEVLFHVTSPDGSVASYVGHSDSGFIAYWSSGGQASVWMNNFASVSGADLFPESSPLELLAQASVWGMEGAPSSTMGWTGPAVLGGSGTFDSPSFPSAESVLDSGKGRLVIAAGIVLAVGVFTLALCALSWISKRRGLW